MAKRAGFSVGSLHHYEEGIFKLPSNNNAPIKYAQQLDNTCPSNDEHIAESWWEAPTQCLLQKWLRENYKIHIMVNFDYRHNSYFVEIIFNDDHIIIKDSDETYEDALEYGLQESLKLLLA